MDALLRVIEDLGRRLFAHVSAAVDSFLRLLAKELETAFGELTKALLGAFERYKTKNAPRV